MPANDFFIVTDRLLLFEFLSCRSCVKRKAVRNRLDCRIGKLEEETKLDANCKNKTYQAIAQQARVNGNMENLKNASATRYASIRMQIEINRELVT